MMKNYYLAINLANNFQSRYPGIGTTTIPGFGIEKSGRDPGIRDPGIAIPSYRPIYASYIYPLSKWRVLIDRQIDIRCGPL